MSSAFGIKGGEARADDAIAGFVISFLGFVASLYPGDLFVAVPLLLAGLYVSIAGLRVANKETGRRRLAIAGVALGVLGLLTTAILFALFIA
jgi:hypothetical protein